MDAGALTYFISHETVVAADTRPGMRAWREEIFALMQRNAEVVVELLVGARPRWARIYVRESRWSWIRRTPTYCTAPMMAV